MKMSVLLGSLLPRLAAQGAAIAINRMVAPTAHGSYAEEALRKSLETLDQKQRLLDSWAAPMPGTISVPFQVVQEPNPPLAPRVEKPGCTAADETLLVHAYLDRLAAGEQGFGVLAIGKQRLEAAAQGARERGREDLAGEILAVADDLPSVQSPERAREVLRRLEPIIPETWELGRTCKAASNPALVSRAQELANDVRDGKVTREAAVVELQRMADGEAA
jgi:hypothetical protein